MDEEDLGCWLECKGCQCDENDESCLNECLHGCNCENEDEECWDECNETCNCDSED